MPRALARAAILVRRAMPRAARAAITRAGPGGRADLEAARRRKVIIADHVAHDQLVIAVQRRPRPCVARPFGGAAVAVGTFFSLAYVKDQISSH